MTASRVHVLDANVFIEAHRHYYAFDIAPNFWMMLIENAKRGQLLSIDLIEEELKRGKDQLADWASDCFHEFFASTDDGEVTDAYRKIMIWSQGQAQFTNAAKAEFANVPDSWLVAFALAKKCVVVTQEQFSSDAKARIKIPNACRAFSVEYADTFQMIRELGVRLG